MSSGDLVAVGFILFSVIVLTLVGVIAGRSGVDLQDEGLSQKVRAAERQIREIGWRTRAAIIEEAMRRNRHDPP
jgi:hypothetical protein